MNTCRRLASIRSTRAVRNFFSAVVVVACRVCLCHRPSRDKVCCRKRRQDDRREPPEPVTVERLVREQADQGPQVDGEPSISLSLFMSLSRPLSLLSVSLALFLAVLGLSRELLSVFLAPSSLRNIGLEVIQRPTIILSTGCHMLKYS